MSFLLQLFLFLLFLNILVIIHEVGHFVTAKSFGVYCYEFAIGMGPQIWSKKFGETQFSVRIFPIGGYVAMAGETNDERIGNIPLERTINGIKNWKKAVVMAAGVILNLVLGYVILFSYITAVGIPDPNPKVLLEVTPDSLIYQGGLRTNDEITQMAATLYDENNNILVNSLMANVDSYQDILDKVRLTDPIADGNKQCLEFVTTRGTFAPICRVNVELTRNSENEIIDINPKFGFRNVVQYKHIPLGQSLIEAFKMEGEMAVLILTSLKTLFTKEGISQVSGPIGMYTIANSFLDLGIWQYFYFWAVISINLAVINLLPIPGLDGSRLIVLAIESITQKKIKPEIENTINALGLFFLLGLMLLIAIKDIVNLF